MNIQQFMMFLVLMRVVSVIVMQFMLRALEGDEAAVTHSIQLMLECAGEEEPKEGLVLENAPVEKIVDMIQDSSSSHLMEVRGFVLWCQ